MTTLRLSKIDDDMFRALIADDNGKVRGKYKGYFETAESFLVEVVAQHGSSIIKVEANGVVKTVSILTLEDNIIAALDAIQGLEPRIPANHDQIISIILGYLVKQSSFKQYVMELDDDLQSTFLAYLEGKSDKEAGQ